MSSTNLCEDKKFPDLEDDFFISKDKKGRITFIDEKNNIWIEGEKISEGGHGKVYEFISYNKDYSDLAVKFFSSKDVEEYILDMEEETAMINFFNLHKCKNFLKSGIKEIGRNEKIIIMEKVDGDMLDFDFHRHNNPLKLFKSMVRFILDGSLCALKKGKYYMDMKEENIGFKICKDKVMFTFLDFGSFFDTNNNNILTTYNINKRDFNKGNFSNETIFVFGIIITFLTIRLKIFSRSRGKRFSQFILKSQEDNYPSSNFLSEDYFRTIRSYYFYLFEDEDVFVEILFEYLEDLTFSIPKIYQFLKELKQYL